MFCMVVSDADAAGHAALESITMHEAIWPLVKEMTANQPRLVSGTLSYQQHDPDRTGPEVENLNPGGLHCAREGRAWGTRYAVASDQQGAQGNQDGEGKIFCAPLVVFFYLTDVHPGDGGLIVLPVPPLPRPPICCPLAAARGQLSKLTYSALRRAHTGPTFNGRRVF